MMSAPPATPREIAQSLNRIVGQRGTILNLMASLWTKEELPQAFRGGDWRGVDFSGLDVRSFNFQNARLFQSKFVGTKVSGANFLGVATGDLAPPDHMALEYGLHHAPDWAEAVLTADQRSKVAELAGKFPTGGGANTASGKPLRALSGAQLVESLLKKPADSRSPQDWVSLIRNAEDYDAACALLDEMVGHGHFNNPFAFTTVFDKAKSDADREGARDRFHSYVKDGGELDLKLLTAAITIQSDYPGAKEIFDSIAGKQLRPDSQAYSAFLSKHNGQMKSALKLVDRMRTYGVPINEKTAFSLFDASDTFYQAVQVLIKMHEMGVDIFTNEFIQELIEKSRFPDITEWYAKARQEDMRNVQQIIGAMIRQCLQNIDTDEILRRLALW